MPDFPDAEWSGLIPIVIGVTGHRDLRDVDIAPLEAAVRAFLERLARDYPHSPLILLTPLAEGADRLAARVALELGGRLVVTLPLPRDRYRQDFPSSGDEFDRLIDDPRTLHRLELPALAPGEARDLQYALAGAYVARHCHILLALWDGAGSDAVGGTAQDVAYRTTGHVGRVGQRLDLVPEPYGLNDNPLDPPDRGPVYHIPTPRRGHPSPDRPFSGRWIGADQEASSDDGARPAALAASLGRIDVFNADARRLASLSPGTVDHAAASLHEGALSPGPAGLRRAFALADVLAARYQRETYRVMWIVYALAMLAVVSFQLYAHALPGDDPRVVLFLAGYVGVLAVADIVYLASRHRQSQSKFQDYRAVAEGLRVQFYWRLAGLEHSAADHYLRKQRDELAWIREAIRAGGIAAAPAPDGEIATLGPGWIENQRAYYTRTTGRERHRLAQYRAVAGGVIVASLLWAIPTVAINLRAVPDARFDWSRVLQVPLLLVSLVLAWHLAFSGTRMLRGARARGGVALGELPAFLMSALAGGAFLVLVRVLAVRAHARWPEVRSDAHDWSVLALTLITVAGALIHSITDKRAFGEHARQYARMAESFTRAGDRMSALLLDGDASRARRLALELGKEALAEHGDWLMLHRERPIKLPKV